jgi:Uma2 family endonuclease
MVEVLSDSTQDYDRGKKFAAYQTLPTFEEYLLVDQSQVQVEHYVKQLDKKWLFTEYNSTDVRISLVSISLEIALADIYEKLSLL